MKKFKEFIIEFDSPQIYCDMDGVLADFVKFTREHLGQKFTDEKWHELPHDLFYQLPPMRDAKHFGNLLEDRNQHHLFLLQYQEKVVALFQKELQKIRRDG